MMTPGQFFDSLVGVAVLTGASLSSQLRSKFRNERVGGVTNSRHLIGYAVDAMDFSSPESKGEFIDFTRAMGYQVVDEGDHVHVEAF